MQASCSPRCAASVQPIVRLPACGRSPWTRVAYSMLRRPPAAASPVAKALGGGMDAAGQPPLDARAEAAQQAFRQLGQRGDW